MLLDPNIPRPAPLYGELNITCYRKVDIILAEKEAKHGGTNYQYLNSFGDLNAYTNMDIFHIKEGTHPGPHYKWDHNGSLGDFKQLCGNDNSFWWASVVAFDSKGNKLNTNPDDIRLYAFFTTKVKYTPTNP